jgi:hypothetical protein
MTTLGSAATGAALSEPEVDMRAAVGDRVVVPGSHVDEPTRDGEGIEVHGEDGAPPWVVRWSADGHESLYFPGPDAQVHHGSEHTSA